jgi:hypothetical protein
MTGAIDRLDVPELLDGAVDCYVHGMPDLIPRLCDDVVMARQCAEAGLAAAFRRTLATKPAAVRSALSVGPGRSGYRTGRPDARARPGHGVGGRWPVFLRSGPPGALRS